jgi:hypothetical protein
MTQDEIDKWVAAYHEAGHAVATFHSRHFVLKDPAILLTNIGTNLAMTAISGPSRAQWGVEHAREFAIIGVGGYSGQIFLEALRPGWTTKKDGCDQDMKNVGVALSQFNIQDQLTPLLSECRSILINNPKAVQKLAELIFSATADIPKADVVLALSL